MIMVMVVCAISACDHLPFYSHYEHTPSAGWEKNDTLSFCVQAARQAGHYQQMLGLRINDDYPFQSVSLVVQQTILPSGYRRSDTINCSLFTPDGRVKGAGIKHYHYNFHLNTMQLKQGDSLHILVRHNMKREIIPGITDVGIRIDQK